ncbi:MAG TPA: ATP-binding protein [Flavisolibacter sp.]|nr:ATP-binding protein [Flavisolibacter sp.]
MATTLKSNQAKPLRGIERQKAFLENAKKNGLSDDSFFVIDKVMESMRDNGYRDIRKAINDLIDNAEQAGAKRISVVTTTEKPAEKGAKERISNIAIVDDGHGMFPEMLPIAVKWGGTDRHDQRDGLGRFGFGLPTASISVTKVYEVYSKVKGGEWHKIRIDLTEIAAIAVSNGGHISYPLKAVKTDLPPFLKTYVKDHWKKNDLEQGTIVLLIQPDRIRRFSHPPTFQLKMLQNIGLTYRHYMPDVSFMVNDKKVEMVDPLFLNPISLGYDASNGVFAESIDEMNIRVKNTLVSGRTLEGNVRFRFSIMPPWFQRDKEGGLINSRWKTMKENNGYFIVTRSGRQIDVVKEPYYQSDDDNITIVNYDANWAIELDFDPSLDELFGITTNKQQVEIDTYLWDLFKDHDLPATVNSLRKKLQKMRVAAKIVDEEKNEDSRDSEQIMTAAEKFDKLDLPQEKEEAGEQKLVKEAQEVAKKEKREVQEVTESLHSEAEKKKYKVEFTDLPGAPFYEVEIWGPQLRLKINTAHRFYTDVYLQQENRGKTAIELLLFVIGKCECQSDGDKSMFYGSERYEWSRQLDLRLRLLDKKDPVLDKQSDDEERKN